MVVVVGRKRAKCKSWTSPDGIALIRRPITLRNRANEHSTKPGSSQSNPSPRGWHKLLLFRLTSCIVLHFFDCMTTDHSTQAASTDSR